MNTLLKQRYAGFYHAGIWLFCLLGLVGVLAGCRSNIPLPTVQDRVQPALATATLPTPQQPDATPELAATTSPDSTPTLAPPSFPISGIEMHAIAPANVLEYVVESGAYWIRRNALLWSQVEPEPGARNWEAIAGLEVELKTAAANGLHVILVIRSTPAWAQKYPGVACGPPAPDRLAAFASFIHAVVARYSIPPYSVKFWEIGNEPDVDKSLPPDSQFGCMGEAGDPYYGGRYYADILKAVYPQAKAADPQAQVLVGGLLLNCDPVNPPETAPGSGVLSDCTPSRYLEGILENSGGDFFDGVSFHAYDVYQGALGQYSNPNWHAAWNTSGPVLIAKARFLRSVLAKYNHPEKYLVNTEVAIICGRDGTEPACQTEQHELTKAYYLAQVYASAAAEGLRANIWYSITGWRASGLLLPDLTPGKAYQAFQVSAVQLKDAYFVDALRQFDGVKGYIFARGQQFVWILWSADGQEHTLALVSTPASVTDVFGNSLPPTQPVTVTMMPLYLTWTP